MKKLIPIIIAAAMLCTVFTASDSDALAAYLYVNGEAVDDDATGDGWTYVKSTNTLTLDNATLDIAFDADPISSPVFYTGSEPFNIVLVGNNTISGKGSEMWPTAIYASSNLTISGSGSLETTDGYNRGIWVSGDLVIDGVDITFGKGEGESVYTAKSLTISDAIIHAQGPTSAKDITFHGCYLYCTPVVYVLYATNVLSIDGSPELVNINITNGESINHSQPSIISYLKDKTITFDANGGICGTPSKSTDIDGKINELPTPTRSGYIFNGWFTAATDGNEVTTDSIYRGDTTLYAHWTVDPTPTPDDPGSKSDNKGTSTALIAGGIVAIVAIILLAGALISKR